MKILVTNPESRLLHSLTWMLTEMHIPFEMRGGWPTAGESSTTAQILVDDEHWDAAVVELDGICRAIKGESLASRP